LNWIILNFTDYFWRTYYSNPIDTKVHGNMFHGANKQASVHAKTKNILEASNEAYVKNTRMI
jgi:hypothetical protein